MVTFVEFYRKTTLWRPFAYGAPRIVSILVMSAGLILTAFVAAGCTSARLINYNFFLMEMRYQSSDYSLPTSSCANCASCGITNFTKIPVCTSLIVRVSYFGICVSDNVTAVACSAAAVNAPSLDPLMIIDFAKSLTHSVVSPSLLILSLVFSALSMVLQLSLFSPALFSWRHARNIHSSCIVCTGSTAFFLFLTALMTTSSISGSLGGVTIISLQVIAAERGVLLEAFTWGACGVWTFAFLFVWGIRRWEILERREVKRDVVKLEERKKQAALRNMPTKAEESVLVQMASSQM